MKKVSTFLLMLSCVVISFAQTVTLTFTGHDATNAHLTMDSVVVTNLTRSWQEVLYCPDTILQLTNNVGIEDYDGSFMLRQNVPNPFEGTTQVYVRTNENEKATISVYDLLGNKIISTTQVLSVGEHVFQVALTSPQTYLFQVTTKSHKASIKIMNTGNGGADAIEYLGEAKMPYANSKLVSTNVFGFGDLMEYVGYVTVDGVVHESDRVLLQQGTSQTHVLNFDVVIPFEGKIQPVFYAPLMSDCKDYVSGNFGVPLDTVITYTADGMYFENNYVSFSTGWWQNITYNTPFTILFDYKRMDNVVNRHMSIVCTGSYGNDRGIRCYCHNGSYNALRVGINYSPSYATTHTISTPNTATLNVAHIKTGFIYDGNGTLTRVQDGVITSETKVYSQGLFPNFSNLPLTIGGLYDYGVDYWIGTISHVMIFDSALSQEEINTITY